MAQLRDSLITGDLRVTGTIYGNLVGDITGNAGSATQLQNARTLWGQSFNGTANVSGNMSIAGNISNVGELTPISNNTYSLGSSNLRWAKLYIGTADSYGSLDNAPIYWNNGIPAPINNISLIDSATGGRFIKVGNSNGVLGLYASQNRGLYDFTTNSWIIYSTQNDNKVYIPLWASKGSDSQPIYFNSSGEPVACTPANIQAGKDDSGNTITSTYVKKAGDTMTGALITTGLTSTGNITSERYLYIKAWPGYGSGTAAAWYNGNTSTLVWDKKISATEFIGPLTGNATTATKATQDEDGNTISSTYFKHRGSIPASKDLSDYTTVGSYFNATGNNNGTNTGFAHTYGYVISMGYGSTNYQGLQLEINHTGKDLTYRTHWSSWKDKYKILTTANTITIAQGGTGATDAENARTNLGLGSMATETASDYLKLSGGTMTGDLTLKGDPTNNLHAATKQYVDQSFAANDAMIFKGTIGTGGTITALPATHNVGWTYRVITAGKYANIQCEIGDLIICITDGTSANNAHWTVAQTNIDGAVVGPASATEDRFASFNGTTGKLIKDSGYSASSFAASGHNHDTVYVKKAGDTMVSSLTIQKAGGCGLEVDNTQTTNPNKVAFIVGASGNGGIFSRKHSKWIVYSDPSGNVVLNGNAASATYLKDRTNNTATYSNYGAAGLAGSAISWMTCWNGYELRAISKAETFNVVRDNGGDDRWVKKSGDTMSGNLTVSKSSSPRIISQDSTHNGQVILGWASDHKKHGVVSGHYSTDGATATSDTKWLVYRDANGNVHMNGNAATATKATQDGDGNTITSTYVKKSGDTMSGNLTITSNGPRFIGQDSTHNGQIQFGWSTNHQSHGIYSTGYSVDGSALTSSGKWMIYRDASGNVLLQGNADSATKLTSDAGNATQPVYFSGGKPNACTHKLQAYVHNVTVVVAAWNTTNKTLTLTSSAVSNIGKVTANSLIVVTPQGGITDAEFKAYEEANIIGTSQSSTQIVLKAMGTVPTINIPITVSIYLG